MPAGRPSTFETLLFDTEDSVTTIRFNRPQKKNAVSLVMYNEIIRALELAGLENSTITVFTGSGDFYSSGNDLNNISTAPGCNIEDKVKATNELFRRFVKAFIDFPKPLIALVNGPAVGVAVTVLGLFDVVYATEKATFHTPFTQLGLVPEGCSSYTFPKTMGPSKASEMLLFNKKLTATEACLQGLVSEVFSDGSFQKEVWERIKTYAKLPRNSLVKSKQLMRAVEREWLHAVNDGECERLLERSLSDECVNAIASFHQARAKL